MTLTLLDASETLRTDGNALRFVVLGHARPAGSKRAFKHPVTGQIIVKDDADSRAWRSQVAGEAVDARAKAGHSGLLVEPLAVEFTFYRPRPKSHYGTGRNAGTLKASAPGHPATRPDALKLARAVEDSCTGTLWRDDAQIVDERLRKCWGEPERVEIVVRVL